MIFGIIIYIYKKKKNQDKGNLCYMNTNSVKVNIKTKDAYKEIANQR